jgi:hypothetical protein
MTNIIRHIDLSVPAATVWNLVGAPASIADWHPAIVSSPIQGDRRTCTFPDGAKIVETISAHDDARMQYTYTIVEGAVPMRDYVSTLEVIPVSDQSCKLQWSGTFEPLGPEAEVSAFLAGVYQAGLDSVRARLMA